MRIAVAQTQGTRLDQWRETLSRVEDVMRQAHSQGAELVILPECVWPAYCLGSAADYFAARETGMIPPDAFLDQLCGWAKNAGVGVCAGYVEERGERLANTACLIDATGRLLGVHRKCFLWVFDHDYFEPGDVIEPIETPWGRIGVMICADARPPEITATLAAKGVDLILQPTGWVNAGMQKQPWNPQPDFLIAARAAEFGVPIASASKWGIEGGTTFVGSSLICDAEGAVVTQCGQRETAVAVGDVTLRRSTPIEITDEHQDLLLSDAPPAMPSEDVGSLAVRAVEGECAIEVRVGDDTWTITPGDTGIVRVGGVGVGVLCLEDMRSFAPSRCLALRGVHVIAAMGDSPASRSSVGKSQRDSRDGAGALHGLLQARACENRVFVVEVAEGMCRVIDPSGRFVGGVDDEELDVGTVFRNRVTLSCKSAARKCVAPRTDMIRGRRPSMYSFRL